MKTVSEKLLEVLKDENKPKTVIAQNEGYILIVENIISNENQPERVSSFLKLKRTSRDKNYKLYIMCAVGNGLTFDTLVGDVEVSAELDEILTNLASEYISQMQKMFIESF